MHSERSPEPWCPPVPRDIRSAARVLLLAALAWLAPTLVAAAPTAPTVSTVTTDRCVAADALAGLTSVEQRSLAHTCRQRAAPDPAFAPLLARVVARADWESAALAELLAGGAPHQDLGPDLAAAARLRAARDALRGRLAGCAPVHRALDAYFTARDAGDLPGPPFTASTVAGCLPSDPDALTDLALLTIPVDDATTDLFVAAAAGPRIVLQWFTAADAVVRRGRRVFVVAVPRWSVVTVRAAAPSISPKLWHGFVTYHQTVWDSPPAASCLRLSVELDPDTTLLLDGQVLTRGQPIAHRTVGVHAGAHTLVAVRCAHDTGGTCVTRFRETLPPIAASASENLCQDVSLDLHQRRSVAILQARAAPGCDAALAWRAGELAAEHLRRTASATGRTFSDLASFASITQALGVLRDGLNPSSGRAVGAATGSDSLDLVASVAKEAWRQGIDELVTLELRCTGNDAGLRLQATKISVREVLDGSLGPVAGLDLQNFMGIVSHPFDGEAQLPSTVANVLDGLFGRDFFRIREGPTVLPYREKARIEVVGSFKGDASLTTFGPRVDARLDPRARCDAMRKHYVKQAHALPVAASVKHDTAKATLSVYTFRSRGPGMYLVTKPLSERDEAYCIEFVVPPREVWASVVVAPDIFLRTPISRVAARHLRVLLGHTWYPWRPWLGLGVVGGYTYTHYAGPDGVPAWQDFATDPAVSHQPRTWSRHAVVVGPLLEFRSRHARIPVEFRGRASAGVGMAIVDVGDLTAFSDFAGSSRWGTTNLRLRPTLDATFELGVSAFAGPVAITPLIALGATALNDMAASKWAVSATGGAGLYTGFGLLLGGAP